MAYKKQVWVDLETPLDAEHMNYIENGLGELSEEMVNLQDTVEDFSVPSTEIHEVSGWIDGGAFNTYAGVPVDLVNGLQIVSDRSYMILDYKAGDTYYVTGEGGMAYRLWAFIDADGNILSMADQYFMATNYLITFNQDCKLLVQAQKNAIHLLYKEISVLRLATTKPVKMDGWIDGKLYNTAGTTVDLSASPISNNDYTHLIVNYKAGDIYRITGQGGESPRLWAFVADDGTILNAASKYYTVSDFPLTFNEDCKLIVQCHRTQHEYALFKEDRVNIIDEFNAVAGRIKNLENTSYVFGTGINCDYETPVIPAFDNPGQGNRLSYFYGLYDALVSTYPDYVSKIDCDAEMASLGITKPSNMDGCPTYMYKFEPKFTWGEPDLTSPTKSNPVKLFITTGTHGEELMAVWDMYHMMRLVCEEWQNDANLEALRWECIIYIIPCSNPVGVESGTRINANGVDPNRNCPTSEWTVRGTAGMDTYSGAEAGSEYETKVFMHYLDAINPHLYIDHHDCWKSNPTSFYATSREQIMRNIACTNIASRCRKMRMRMSDVFPENDWKIDGFVYTTDGEGTRTLYGYEQGYHSITYETNEYMFYKDGVYVPEGTDEWSSNSSTIAVDGFLNFVLLALKELAKQPFVSAE